MIPPDERYIEVDDIYVTPAHHSQGIGSDLLEGILQLAERDGVTRRLVFSATKDLTRILAFYQRHGFTPWGVQMFR